MAGMTVIVRTASRLMFPFIILFGLYVIIHGHLTPGGGFPGGVIISAGVVMMVLAYGIEEIQRRVRPLQAEFLESIGGVAIAIIGLLGIFAGAAFLQNVFATGQVGQLLSAGNLPLLYLSVGVKVTAGLLLIFFAMLFAFWGEK